MMSKQNVVIRNLVLFISLFSALVACSHKQTSSQHPPVHIAFGSCLRQWQEQPVWQAINSLKPNAFIFAGDNVYSDVGAYKNLPEPQRIATAYQDLFETSEFQQFLENARKDKTRLFAVWDDHDYGRNDAGADYPYRIQSKKYFSEFFQVKRFQTTAQQAGTYRAEYLNVNGINVQILLLDTRSFRSPLQTQATTEDCPRVNHGQNRQTDATILGAAQWLWLREALQKPADVRLLVSSIQVLPTEHCFEKWQNFPLERARLLDLLQTVTEGNTIILSGDRHLAEISRISLVNSEDYLYEITSSGLNSAVGNNSPARFESNALRVSRQNVTENNFASINMQKLNHKLLLNIQIRNESGDIMQQIDITMNE